MKIFYLPDLGEGLPEAEIREWFIQEGDFIQADQPMVSMETAKAVVEVPAPKSGRISKLYGKIGEMISTGAPLVEFEGDDTEEPGTVVGRTEISNIVLPETSVRHTKSSAPSPHAKTLPAVRALAKQLNIDLNTIIPSGTGGQITAEDVKKAVSQGTKKALQPDFEPVQGVRRAMAISMTNAHQQVVPITLMDDAPLLHWSPNMDITLCVIKAILAGCHAEPILNSWFDGETLSHRIIKEVNLGLAVDSNEGLFVPVLKNTDTMSAQKIRESIDYFKKAVQKRSIKPEELRGATFTLSNFGAFAGRYGNPIIIPPTVAILGVGRLREHPYVTNGQITIQKVLPLSLTIDHRAITGGEASRFLAMVIQNLETAI